MGLIAKSWLKIADSSAEFIFDKKCLKLAELHSQAVDYQKSGNPVPWNIIPTTKGKPDWDAPEIMYPEDQEEYYESSRAIGQMFRDIDLPAMRTYYNAGRAHGEASDDEFDPDIALDEDIEGLEALRINRDERDPVTSALLECHPEYLGNVGGGRQIDFIPDLFQQFQSELEDMARSNALTRKGKLIEEELLLGTILARTSQPRQRKNLMARMRESSAHLVERIRDELEGGKDRLPPNIYLDRSWAAWLLSVDEKDTFGARSFGFIALSCVLEAINELEIQKGTSKKDGPLGLKSSTGGLPTVHSPSV